MSEHRPPLDPAQLRPALRLPWTGVRVVEETASTNVGVLGSPPGSVLVAEYQSSGRGRLDRNWVAPRGSGLTFSVLLRPLVPRTRWGWLPLLAGLALHDAVSPLAPASLKWPNDLLLTGAGKLAGVLAQADHEDVVIGIGLNVSTTADELPVPTATSLLLAGVQVDRGALLVSVLDALGARVLRWQDAGGDAEECGAAADYRAACATIGMDVMVTGTDGVAYAGTGVGVDGDGRLRLRVGLQEQVLAAGDVEHLRPR
ncbi:MAG TPA: biotin--[acetyl-CoA-carboxylase] ligase [Jatrophihabitantaceae bacterium]|jgi:BirA family biotin operon repressor/biotin-[acetyl-CoA-carboxylase] ligase|nr:biotin--[acetyl-CoA-carboxylase] ligase [Jatrophihabitantaceae bacterium]